MDAGQLMEDGGRGMPRILMDLAEGRLSEAEAEAVVTWVTDTGVEDVPPWVVNRAVRIAHQASAQQPPRPTPWRRLVAVLVYDTRLRPQAAGAHARGLERGTGPPRLRYEAGGVEIDLEVGDSGLAGRIRLLGQVAAEGPDLARAWVVVDGPSGHREAPLDALGQFSLDGLATGTHRLEVNLAHEQIDIPELVL